MIKCIYSTKKRTSTRLRGAFFTAIIISPINTASLSIAQLPLLHLNNCALNNLL